MPAQENNAIAIVFILVLGGIVFTLADLGDLVTTTEEPEEIGGIIEDSQSYFTDVRVSGSLNVRNGGDVVFGSGYNVYLHGQIVVGCGGEIHFQGSTVTSEDLDGDGRVEGGEGIVIQACKPGETGDPPILIIEHSIVEHQRMGVLILGSGVGVVKVLIEDSTFLSNRLFGIKVTFGSLASGPGINIFNSTVRGEPGSTCLGLEAVRDDNIRLWGNDFIDCDVGLSIEDGESEGPVPSQHIPMFRNTFDGNYDYIIDTDADYTLNNDPGASYVNWDGDPETLPVDNIGNNWEEYVGQDLDFDGIGETPHVMLSELGRLGSATDNYPFVNDDYTSPPGGRFDLLHPIRDSEDPFLIGWDTLGGGIDFDIVPQLIDGAVDGVVDPIVSAVWDFGDGEEIEKTGSEVHDTFQKSYDAVGTYTITVDLTTESGLTNTELIKRHVNVRDIAEEITAFINVVCSDYTVKEGEIEVPLGSPWTITLTAQFSSVSNSDQPEYKWYVDGDEYRPGEDPAPEFTEIQLHGMFGDVGDDVEVEVVVDDGIGTPGGADVIIRPPPINFPPDATIRVGKEPDYSDAAERPNYTAIQGETIQFSLQVADPNQGDIVEAFVDFGDGSNESRTGISGGIGQSKFYRIPHTYDDTGIYLVNFTASDDSGGYDNTNLSVRIIERTVIRDIEAKDEAPQVELGALTIGIIIAVVVVFLLWQFVNKEQYGLTSIRTWVVFVAIVAAVFLLDFFDIIPINIGF
jgi:hypothetical protein